MSQVVIKTGLPEPARLNSKEIYDLNLVFKRAMVELRIRSLSAAIRFVSVDRVVWTYDDRIPTAAIMMYPGRHTPDIYINLNFLDKMQKLSDTKGGDFLKAFASLIAHELMHFILRHLGKAQQKRIKNKDMANLVFDVFINHFLLQLDLVELMRLYYPSAQIDEVPVTEQVELVLDGEVVKDKKGKPVMISRPTGEKEMGDTFPMFFLNPTIPISKINKVHRDAWNSINKVQWTLEQIEEYLTKHMPKQQTITIKLLGSHGDGEESEGESQGGEGSSEEGDGGGQEGGDSDGGDQGKKKEPLPSGVQQEAEDVVREIFTKGKTKDNFNTGYSKFGTYFEERLKVEKTKNEEVDTMVLRAMTQSVKGTMYKALGIYESDRRKQTVFPTFDDKTTMVLLGNDYTPYWYDEPVKVNRGKAVFYTDVSGSMNGIKDILYSLLIGLEQEYEIEIWLFSTELHELTKEELKEGIVHTTGGTDFDIWIDHLIENDYEKVLVITDGYCSVSEKNKTFLEESNTELFVIYTNGYDNSALEKYTVAQCVLDHKEF